MKTPSVCFPSAIHLALFCTVVAIGAGCHAAGTVVGSGHVVSETRAVRDFHGVELSSSGDVIVTQGDTEGLVVEAEDNILPLLATAVGKDGILHLGFKEHAGSVSTSKTIVFKVAAKTMDAFSIGGSGSIKSASLTTDHLNIEVPGSGDVAVAALKANAVKAGIDGSGSITLIGEVHTQRLTCDGSGKYLARDLKTADTTVEINGSGTAEVSADGSLTVQINGSGDVGYGGNPKLKKQLNGSGQIHRLGETRS